MMDADRSTIEMFPPRYHGTTFNVNYWSDPNQKGASKAHLITSRDFFELISLDWRTSLQRYLSSEIDRVETKKATVVVSFKPSTKYSSVTFSTSPDPIEPLIAALSQVLSLPKQENRFLSHRAILPSFKFSSQAQSQALHKAITEQTCQFLQTFCSSSGSIAVNCPFVDVFTCVYRMRYRNEGAQVIDQSVKSLGLDIRRHIVATWCGAIVKCQQPADTHSAQMFYARVAQNAGNTVVKASSALGIQTGELLRAVTAFAEEGKSEGVAAAAKQIAKEAVDATDREIAKVLPHDLQNLRFLMDSAVIMLAGIAARMYPVDVDRFAAKVVEYTQAVLNRNQVDAARKALVQTQQIFMRDMVCLLDGQRYDEPFQFIFCIWGLRENMDAAA
jgi:hypothetical protein